jgi:hypothetical protein
MPRNATLSPTRSVWLSLAALLGAMVAPGCECGEPVGSDGDGGRGRLDGQPGGGSEITSGVWLAQTHVERVGGLADLAFADEALSRQVGRDGLRMLELVGGRDTLLLVDAPSPTLDDTLVVSVEVRDAAGDPLFDATLEAPTEPSSGPTDLGGLVHDFATSYSVILPGEAIVPGMQLEVRYTRGDVVDSDVHAIDVGAPTVLRNTMFDFDYFATRGDRILADAVLDEVGWKLPVRELRVQRVDTLIRRAAIAPHEQTVDGTVYRTPWIAATSFEDWATRAEASTGVAWLPRNDRSVDHSQMLLGTLLAAGGQAYIVGMHGNFTDGTMGNFKGRGGSNMLSSSTSANVLNARNIFVHEFSHTLDLWHWHEGAGANYPYRGAMFGIEDSPNGVHCGPVWRWRPPALGDGPRGAFVAPYLMTEGGTRRYRRVVSTSGSRDDRSIEFEELVGTFSDWDTRVTQEWLESVVRVWNPDLGAWATWDHETSTYARRVGGTPGVELPLDPDPVSVYSVLVAASVTAPDANLVYDPIGPYESGLLRRFDPQNTGDVAAAAALEGYCPEGGCDYSVRVVQGGMTRVFMLRASEASGGPTSDDGLRHVAINVPSSDGEPERIELLATPDAQVRGMPAAPAVLDVWTR